MVAANSQDVIRLVREMDKRLFVPNKNAAGSENQPPWEFSMEPLKNMGQPYLAADWFNSKEEQIQFYAEKALESYNRDNPEAKLTLVEAVMSFRVIPPCVPMHVHVNFRAKDKDGTVHLVFAELTFDVDPILVSFCILEPGDSDDYSHHRKGCGECDPESPIPLYHPPDDRFKHGKGVTYRRLPPLPPPSESLEDIPEKFRSFFCKKRRPPTCAMSQ